MSAEPIFIKRKTVADPCSFDALYKEGIKISQDLSGHIWTDYNTHDPGVTILEQLCYVLTDIAYRVDYPVIDFLVEDDNNFDLAKSSLIPPEVIFSCHPTTFNDFKYVLLDKIPSIDSVYIHYQNESHCSGLIDLYISDNSFTHEINKKKSREAIKKAVYECYSDNRSLGENVNEIFFTNARTYTLVAEVEIAGVHFCEEILAQIYINCLKKLRYKETLISTNPDNTSLEQIFSGPQSLHTKKEYKFDTISRISISSFFSIIQNIPMVDTVKFLHFENEQGETVDELSIDCFKENIKINIPQSQDEIRVKLSTNAREIEVLFENFDLKFEEIITESLAKKSTKVQPEHYYQQPNPQNRSVNTYSSIQNQFPANYGISFRGVPKSETLERQSQALQLKAYLSIFEQISLKQISNIDEIKQLFSPLLSTLRSKPSQALNNQIVPEVESVLTDEYLQNLIKQDQDFDSYNRKANKVLDYLLALYGEKFSQHSLIQFNYYYSAKKLEIRILLNKIRLLEHIVAVTKNRLKASNLSAPIWNADNISGLQLKTSILLDFNKLEIRSLSFGIFRNSIHINFGADKAEHFQESFSEFSFDNDYINQNFKPVYCQEVKNVEIEDLRKYFKTKFICKQQGVSQHFLKSITSINNLKIGSVCNSEDATDNANKDKPICLVYFNETENCYFSIDNFEDELTASEAASTLSSYFKRASQQSEGMHIIEHNLLGQHINDKDYLTSMLKDFFKYRITVVLPNWTARMSDEKFQYLVEETIAINCPAHIYPTFLWLDLKAMYHFEVKYKKWLGVIKTPSNQQDNCHDKNNDNIEKCSKELTDFLVKQQQIKQRENNDLC
jgi:hypothetical protein